MTQHTQPVIPAASPTQRPPASTDGFALAFLLVCVALAAPLLFAGRLPRPLLLVIVLLLLALFVARGLRTHSVLPPAGVNWANLLLLALLPVGLWASADRATSWPALFKVIAGFAVFYGIVGLAGTRWMRAIPWALLAGSLAVGLIVLLGADWFLVKLPWMPDALYRALPSLRLPWRPEGINPNLAGSTVAWLLLPAAALALWAADKRLRILAALTALLLAFALLLSQSRGAWLGVAAALAVLLLHYRRARWIVPATLLMIALLAVVWGPEQLAGLVLPAAGAGQETALNTLPGRLELWQRALAMLRDFGLTGIGPGQFEPLLMVLYPPFYARVLGGFQHAHNLYLQAALDFGVFGLVAWLALLIGVSAGLVSIVRRAPAPFPADEQALLPLSWGLLGSVAALAVHGLVEAPQVAPRGYALIFALLGAAAALALHARLLAVRTTTDQVTR